MSRGAPFDTGELSASAQARLGTVQGQGRLRQLPFRHRVTPTTNRTTPACRTIRTIWSDPERHSAFVTYAKFMGVENYMNLREDLGAYIRNHSAGERRAPS